MTRLPAQQVLGTTELLSIIVGHFKKSGDPVLSTPTWKRNLCPLVKVNLSFFHAAIRVLWEEMDSLRPFVSLLNSNIQPKVLPCEITQAQWARFKLYSRHTQTILLHKSDLQMLPCSSLFIGMSPLRPPSLFPRLKRLSISDADSLTFIIAFSALPTLECVHIKFDDGTSRPGVGSAAAFTQALSQYAKRLQTIGMHSIDHTTIQNLSGMTSLRRLVLRIRTGGTAQLSPLVTLPLEALSPDVVPSDADVELRGPIGFEHPSAPYRNLPSSPIGAAILWRQACFARHNLPTSG